MTEIPVLCFHKISDRFEWGVNAYPADAFKRLIELVLDEGYRFVFPEETGTVERPAVLTFDDGYASVLQNAVPLLSSLNIPFIIFPVLDYLGRENRWDTGAGGFFSRHLSEDELTRCLQQGGRIGIHGLKHRAFSILDESERIVELKRSYRIIREKFSFETSYFAPPFGEKIDGSRYFEKIRYSFILDNQPWNGENRMVSRFSVYRYETPEMVIRKIGGSGILRRAARAVHLGAKASVFVQRIKR